jgi:uncharacterized protein with beta-barrel porin domain
MMRNRFDPAFRCLVALVFTVIFAGSLFAGSATWSSTPGSNDWNTNANWVPATGFPNGSADTATFALSNTTNVSLSSVVEVNGITFNVGAAAYSITVGSNLSLLISGAGITNNSLITQNFVVNSGADFGDITFTNSATAGTNTVFTNNAATVSGISGGLTDFQDNTTAGSASITNNGGTFSNGRGGATVFAGSSTAASSKIDNMGGVSGGAGGNTQFNASASAGSATITNFASDVSNGSQGGFIEFVDSSTAANATIENKGGGADGAHGGATAFEQHATAGSSHITNDGSGFPGMDASGRTFFEAGPASAGNSTIINNAGTFVNGTGGATFFQDTSTASGANITNNGGAGNQGLTEFQDASTASSATINNNGGAATGESWGETDFTNSSNAGSATINNNAGTGSGGNGGETIFRNSSSASSATITNNGGAIVNERSGETIFFDSSSAGSATLIANGGTGLETGGAIFFADTSTGGTSRVEVFEDGYLDISNHAAPGVTIGSLEGSGDVFLGARNLTVGSNNLSTTFSGVAQDGGENGGTGGSLTKIGTGTLIFSGFGSYSGGTQVDAGVFQLDGSVVSTTVVNAAGTLSGSGIVNASLTNNGTLSPGSPGTAAGTLTVVGNYGQANSATLRIDIGGLAPAQHDLLAVSSSVTLAGTLQLVRLNNFTPMNGDQVIIMTHSGINNSGQFFPVTDNFPGLIRPQVFYDTSDVRVVFAMLNSFASQALTPNQKAVAHNIDDAANDPAAAALIGFLGSELPGNLPHDYDLIAPEELASIYEVGFSQAVVQNNNLQRRMDDIRAGSNGFCANNFVARTSGKDFSKDAGGKVVLPAQDGPEVYIPTENNRWGVFINGSGDFVNVGDDDSNAPGYHITTGDFTFGADYRVSDHFAVGINGGYASSQADLVNDGRVDVDGGKIGAYATVFGKGFFGGKIYIDGAIGGGLNSYNTLRTGLQDELVRGDTDGTEFNAIISYGSDWTFGCFNIGTWSTFQYTNVNIDKFTEEGSLAPLEIQDQGEDSIRGTSGLRASYDIKAGRTLLRPEIRAAWQHEYGDPAYQVDSRLASGAGSIFRVRGPNIGRDAALVGAGLNVQWCPRVSTYVYYDGILGRSNYDNNAVTGGLRVGF